MKYQSILYWAIFWKPQVFELNEYKSNFMTKISASTLNQMKLTLINLLSDLFNVYLTFPNY